MRGLLIYDKVGKARNEWFIDQLIGSANSLGHELKLDIYDGKINFDTSVDFAVVRTINPLINEYFEELGIPCFNNSKTSKIANSKWLTYNFSKELGVPVMDTAKPLSAIEAADTFSFPFVLKTVDGHGGSEVFLVDNREKCKELFSLFNKNRLIVQKLSSEPGVDMRVYMLAGEVLIAAKRSSECDFRSNFSLGGKAEIHSVPDDVKKIARMVCRELDADFVGIDFIRHDGEWILNEIEDVVGTRMIYSLTDLDPARLYIEHIINKLEKSKENVCTTNLP